MRAAPLPDLDSAGLILIGGPYKSGTSALCASIERAGFRNPSILSNPSELGHGRAVELYATRECSVARGLNRRIVSSGEAERCRIERQISHYLLENMGAIGNRLVIKDPYMKLTAHLWARAARSLGIRSIRTVLSVRRPEAIREAQGRSLFLQTQLRKYPEVFRQLVEPMRKHISDQLKVMDCCVQVRCYECATDVPVIRSTERSVYPCPALETPAPARNLTHRRSRPEQHWQAEG